MIGEVDGAGVAANIQGGFAGIGVGCLEDECCSWWRCEERLLSWKWDEGIIILEHDPTIMLLVQVQYSLSKIVSWMAMGNIVVYVIQ